MPEHFVEVPLWDDGGQTDGHELSLSADIRRRLIDLGRVVELVVDGDQGHNNELWDKYLTDGRLVERDLRDELGPGFDVRLWIPTFLRKP